MDPGLIHKMIIPESFDHATDQEIEANTNGCGPEGWLNLVVPDEFFGVDVRFACQIHDWMYYKGRSWEDKIRADIVFLHNLLTIALEDYYEVSDYSRVQRIRRCYTYFRAVERYGSYAFMSEVEGLRAREEVRLLLPENINVLEDYEVFGGEDPNNEYL